MPPKAHGGRQFSLASAAGVSGCRFGSRSGSGLAFLSPITVAAGTRTGVAGRALTPGTGAPRSRACCCRRGREPLTPGDGCDTAGCTVA